MTRRALIFLNGPIYKKGEKWVNTKIVFLDACGFFLDDLKPGLLVVLKPRLVDGLGPGLSVLSFEVLKPRLLDGLEPGLLNSLKPRLLDGLKPGLLDGLKPRLLDALKPRLLDGLKPKLFEVFQNAGKCMF